jgi:hypothetical protein
MAPGAFSDLSGAEKGGRGRGRLRQKNGKKCALFIGLWGLHNGVEKRVENVKNPVLTRFSQR